MKKSIVMFALLGDPMVPPTSKDSRAGGFNTDVKRWLIMLSQTTFPVIVFTNTSKYFINSEEYIAKNIYMYRIPLEDNSLKNETALMEQYDSAKQSILKIMQENEFLPIFFHSFFWYSGYLAMQLAEYYKVPFVHTVIDLSVYKKLTHAEAIYTIQEHCEDLLLPKATIIFAITFAEKDVLLNNYAVAEKQIIVIGRDVDTHFLALDHDRNGVAEYLNTRNKGLTTLYLSHPVETVSDWWNSGAFLFFGRITEIKGLPYIIKAWYDLYLKYGDNIPPLWIVGGTPNAISNMRDRFLRDIPIDKLESSLKLCWWGYLTPASISALLLKTSVVIMHSRYEAGGLVVIEALASGTPVIATDAGFAHDLVRDWENGFLVPYADVDCLKKRMEHFVIQPLLSRCLGITAQKVYHNAEEFWQSNQTQMEVYNSLWNGNQPISVSIDNRIFFSTSSFQHCILNPLSEDITIANKEKICALLGYSSSDAMSIDISYQKNLSHHSEVWIMNNKNNYYIIKKLYSLLNCDIFWENESIDYGISAIQRIKKNLLSAQSKYIVRIINYNLIDNLYAMEKYENITTINNVSLPQIVHLINDFNHDMLKYLNDFIELESKFNIQNTLPHTGEHIFFSAISKNDYSQKNFFNQLRAEIGVLKKCIHIAKSSELEIPLSIQYGKSFNGHIVSNRKDFLLLPSETIYYGESGLDIARLLIDMWIEKTFMESEIMNDFDICSLESGNSLQRLYLLASIILIVRLKMKFVFDVNPNIKKESKLLSFLTNKLSEIYLHDNM